MWSAIWILAMPVLLQQAMAALLGLMDKVIAGNLPASIVVPALDGIGIASYVGWFIGIAMTGLGIGAQAVISRAIGAGHRAESHRALGQAMVLSLAWGTLVGIGLWVLAPSLGRFCGLTPEAMTYCVQYIRMLSYSMPLCAIMMVGSMCLYGAGQAVLPALVAVLINIVNIVLSWLLSGADIRMGDGLVHNPLAIDLHVIGIALGTSLSYALGAVLIVAILIRGVKDLRLHGSDLGPDGHMIYRIFRVGMPNFMEGIAMWSVNIFVLDFIGQIAQRRIAAGLPGEGLQGAHIIAVQWEAISFLPGFAMGTAAGALAAQYLGAGNARMAQRTILACTGVACVIMGLLGILFLTQGRALTSFISVEPVHLLYVPKLLFICGLVQVAFAVTMVFRAGLRGVGDTRWTFLITTVSSYGVRLPAAWFLGVKLELGLEGIWIALCGELVVRAALFAARFFHGGWKRIRV
jgi:putative MATE family efflux protein